MKSVKKISLPKGVKKVVQSEAKRFTKFQKRSSANRRRSSGTKRKSVTPVDKRRRITKIINFVLTSKIFWAVLYAALTREQIRFLITDDGLTALVRNQIKADILKQVLNFKLGAALVRDLDKETVNTVGAVTAGSALIYWYISHHTAKIAAMITKAMGMAAPDKRRSSKRKKKSRSRSKSKKKSSGSLSKSKRKSSDSFSKLKRKSR